MNFNLKSGKSLLGRILPVSLILSLSLVGCNSNQREVDVLIIGGGASGVAAGVQSARMGVSALIVEESPWLGGMLTSAGVSAVDGNYAMPAGFFGEFRAELEKHYGGADALKTGWVSNVLFEPHVGDSLLKLLASREPNLSIDFNTSLKNVVRDGEGWKAIIVTPEGKEETIKARVLIDGTELGDVAAANGVAYDLGMESNAVTGEAIAPDEANNIIQDLTMCAILKQYDHDVMGEAPEDYDPDEFACSCFNPLCLNPEEPDRMRVPDQMLTYGRLPNGKYMINWPVQGNDYYVNLVELTKEQRDSAINEAKEHTKRFVYFIQKELGYPYLGLADDEFPTEDHLPMIPYHRESRRIHGKVRFNVNHIATPYDTPQPLYRTNIAVGDYPVDHHHKAYHGAQEVPHIYFYPVPSYGLPMGTLIPDSVENLLVTEKSISVSNIANGTTRLQPVVVQIGQAAGVIAALAVKENIPVSEVDVREVQNAILAGGGYIMPFLDVTKDDPRFLAYQRVGATGILRGMGKNVDWNNQTWLRAEEPLMTGELVDFNIFYNIDEPMTLEDAPVTLEKAVALINKAAGSEVDYAPVFAKYEIELQPESEINRGTFALLVDELLDPFNRQVDIEGNFK